MTEAEQRMVDAILAAWEAAVAEYPDVRDDALLAVRALRDGGWLKS